MKRKNATRNALITSMLSMLLCVSMLVGTTFAWFTDQVETGVNTITAGNLDLEVYYALPSDVVDGDIPADSWKRVDSKTPVFNPNALWEPGYTEAVFFKFDNAGSLAFQYQFKIDILNEIMGKTKSGEDIQLSKYIQAYACNSFSYDYTKYLFTDREDATNPAGAPNPFHDTLYNAANGGIATPNGDNPLSLDSWQWLDPTETTYATLVLWMPTEVGNEANHNGVNVPSIDLGIQVVATQYNWDHEKDSFDNNYDKDATYPKVPVSNVAKPEGEKVSVKTPDEVVKVDIPEAAPAGDYELKVTDKTVKTDDEGNTVVSMDITLLKDGEMVNDGSAYTVSVDIGAGLTNLKLFHKDVAIENFDYNVATGIVTFTTTNFSPFTFISQDGGYAVATKSTGYNSLADAIEAVQAGETISFLKDIESVDGVLITDKNITIDMNGKTFTVSDGSSTNNRNFKINGTSEVTIKNGTLIAAGEISSGAYGTIRTEDTAKVTVENMKLYSYRGYGLNVKACSGTTVIINNTEIYSQYSGGVEAAGGTIELTDSVIEQSGVYSDAAWCSVAIGVNSGGKVIVNSGIYSAAPIATDSNAAQGTWIAYVMSSGGDLEINGGTFNGTVAETANALNACGIICADRAAVVKINSGTFNSNGAILDMRNNVGSLPNPVATIAGGTFSADPRVSGLYSSNLISVAEGYEVVANINGTFEVQKIKLIELNGTKYATLEEAVAVAQAGDEIKLLDDVTLASQLTLPAGIILNGNGKQINGTINAGGDLTFEGHTKVTAFSANYYDRTITIGEGACLEVTSTDRVTLGYGNVFEITGSITNAKDADKASVQPSLIIPGGISITGGNDATMNVTNAYVKIGNTSSKDNAANGTFTLNFENAIAEFTNQFTLSEPASGKNPTFNINIKDSVFTTSTKLCIAAPNSNVVIDNSTVTLGSYIRNSGNLTLKNGSKLNGATIQFGENGGNNGTITADNSSLTVTASSTGHAFDGKNTGKIVLQNGAVAMVDYYKAMEISVDSTSTFTGTEVQ